MMAFIARFLYASSLLLPLTMVRFESSLENFILLFGLLLQGFLGGLIFFYIRGYETKNHSIIYLGYSILFLGLAGAYFSGIYGFFFSGSFLLLELFLSI